MNQKSVATVSPRRNEVDFIRNFFKLPSFFGFDLDDGNQHFLNMKSVFDDKQGFPRYEISDISEEDGDKAFKVDVCLAGWSTQNATFGITIDEGRLRIEGARTDSGTNKVDRSFENNISHKSQFSLSISVPDDAEFVKDASGIKDGMLSVVIKVPKPVLPPTKRLELK